MGAVLCGGQSQRFGSDKATAELPSGQFLAQVPIAALQRAGVDPVVVVGGTFSSQLGVPTISDRWPDAGPLAGIASALLYATQPHVAVTLCDMPLLRSEHIKLLLEAVTDETAVIAEVDGRIEPGLGIWPSSWGKSLVGNLRSGNRRLYNMLNVGPYELVSVPLEAIADADTPQELSALLEIDDMASSTTSPESDQFRMGNRV